MILAEYTLQIAAGKENGTGTACTADTGFFSEVWCCTGNRWQQSDTAEATSRIAGTDRFTMPRTKNTCCRQSGRFHTCQSLSIEDLVGRRFPCNLKTEEKVKGSTRGYSLIPGCSHYSIKAEELQLTCKMHEKSEKKRKIRTFYLDNRMICVELFGFVVYNRHRIYERE